DHRFLGLPLTQHLTDNDQPGGDADAHGELPVGGHTQVRDCPDYIKAGTDGALGAELVGNGPTEIAKDAVTHELGNVALIARDLPGNCILIAADDLTQIFRVQPARQSRRADKIDEHDRQLSAIRGRSRTRLLRLRSWGRGIGSNSALELAS